MTEELDSVLFQYCVFCWVLFCFPPTPPLFLPACVPIKLSASHWDRVRKCSLINLSSNPRPKHTRSNPTEQQKNLKTTSRTQAAASAFRGNQRAGQLLHRALISQSPSMTGSLAYATTDKEIAKKRRNKRRPWLCLPLRVLCEKRD